MIEHRSPQSGIAVGPGGLVATAGYDNRVVLWRGRRALTRACHDHLANQCAFDASGRLLVSASSDYTARVWSVPDLRLRAVLGDHEDDVEMAVFDPAGARVATASRDGRVRIFSRDGALLHRMEGHRADVISVAWADDAVVSSSDDGTVRHWDARTGAPLAVVELGAETDTVVVAPDGVLFAGDDRGDIVCIGPAGTHRVAAHRAGIKRLALRGDRLVSSSYDRTLRTWRVDGDRLEPLCATELPAVVWARAVAVDERGRVLTGTFGTTYAAFDPATGAWDVEGVGDTPGLNAVHAAGGHVYTVGDAGRVRRDGVEIARLGSSCNFLARWGDRVVAGGQLGALFDAECGDVLYQHTSPLNCATVTGGGDLVVGTYTGEGLRFTGGRVDVLRLHEQAVKGVAAQGERLFSVSAAGDAALLGAWRRADAHDRIANGVCALRDGRFATVSRDRMLRLWDGDRADVVPSPHTHSIKCVAAGGRFVATGSYDGTIALFDLERDDWGAIVRPTCAGISSLCADGEAFLASAYDGHVWRVDGRGAARDVQAP